jgi:oligoendopeptidase F
MRSQKAHACWGIVQQIAAQIEQRTLFLNLWWNKLDEKQAEKFLEAVPEYRHWLGALRLQRPFTLSESEENIIALKDAVGAKGLLKLYETITGRYRFTLTIDGEIREFKRHHLKDYARDTKPDVRAAAYQEYLRTFERDAAILGQLYQSRVRDWNRENIQLRGYGSPIAVRNLINDLNDSCVDTLLGTCLENIEIFQRYFQLKARSLGVQRLRRYDLFAPTIFEDVSYPFETSVNLVLESFQNFDPQFAEFARCVLDENHLDSEDREAKRPGTFCVSVEPGLTPWVCMTFEGELDDIATLARELGRAVHFKMASHHTAFTQKPPRLLSEVASAFFELLTIDHFIDGYAVQEVQRDLRFKRMDSAYAAITRQAALVSFEREAHDRVFKGATVDDLHELYFTSLRDQFSNSIELSDDFRYEWLGISSLYHLPFYAYAYAFGRLLVHSLYQQYKVEGDLFTPRFKTILAAGGSDSPARILERAGIDISSPEIWQVGFDALALELEALEEIEGL